MQLGFYFDQSRCSGCFACVVACNDWHDIPSGPIFWRRVTVIESGNFPDVFVAFLSSSCYHCSEPACVAACPTEAIIKQKENGIVVVDDDACLGGSTCGACQDACPYDIPQFGPEADAKMQKCDLCLDRWAEGKKPICVQACPMRALDAGPTKELQTKHGKGKEAVGFAFSEITKPSIIFKAKKQVHGD